MKDKIISVVHFQRQTRSEGNFSLEFIFEDVRQRLKDRINFKVVFARFNSNGILRRVRNALEAPKYQGDVNHVTGDIHYINILFQKRKSILTILDCGFMNTDNLIKRVVFKWFWLILPVRKAKFVTTISEASKQDIIKYTGCNPDKIFVIPVAVSEVYQPSPREFNKACPVLLQIGTAVNKNLERLIEAIENIPCKLVVIGKLEEDKLHLLHKYGIQYENRINLSLPEVYEEYKNCDLVTFVSTFEGFGMPIIEANWVERATIAGNNSSMIEVAGDAALLVDAVSVGDIRNGIQSLISNDQLRKDLIERGRENRKRFGGQYIAEMYYSLYQRVYDEQNSYAEPKRRFD